MDKLNEQQITDNQNNDFNKIKDELSSNEIESVNLP